MNQPSARNRRSFLSRARTLLLSRAVWQRPRLHVRAPVYAVVLPDGMTMVQLKTDGWGWVKISATDGPRSALLARSFVWRSGAVLAAKVPVDELVTVIFRNIWGAARTRFEVAATQRKVPVVPLRAMPRAVPVPAIQPVRFSLLRPPLRPEHAVRMGRAAVPTAPRIIWYRPVAAYGPTRFANALSRMSDRVRNTVSTIDADMSEQLQTDTKQK